jgi:pyruvate formate lyase activating enzyme
MIIGGLQKFSLLDYPGSLSAIIFTQGCNFRCQFCYNPMLVEPKKSGKGKVSNNSSSKNVDEEIKEGYSFVKEDALFDFLKSRKGKLDAVVITGGEPTLHGDLPEFIEKIRSIGFKIKLDTNGTNPDMLENLLRQGLLDYIAMDIKAPLKKYGLVTGIKPDLKKIAKSVKIIKDSGLPYEFRTTLVPGLVNEQDIEDMAESIGSAEKWFLQKFKSDVDLVNESFRGTAPFLTKEMEKMRKIALKYVKKCEIR